MKKTKPKPSSTCHNCGDILEPDALFCGTCGQSTSVSTPDSAQSKGSSNALDFVLLALLGLLAGIFAVILLLIVFIQACGSSTSIEPSEFFFSPFSIILAGLFLVIPLGLIVYFSIHRIRRAFFSVGFTSVITAAVLIALGYLSPLALQLFSTDWKEFLLNTTLVFRDYSIVSAIILIIIGSICFSTYSCIAVIKGGNHEQNS